MNQLNSLANRIESIGDRLVATALTEIKSAYESNQSFRDVVRCIKIGSYLAGGLLLIAAVIL